MEQKKEDNLVVMVAANHYLLLTFQCQLSRGSIHTRLASSQASTFPYHYIPKRTIQHPIKVPRLGCSLQDAYLSSVPPSQGPCTDATILNETEPLGCPGSEASSPSRGASEASSIEHRSWVGQK